MQRVSSARSYLRSAVPGTIRHNSTQPTPPPPENEAAPKKPAKLTRKGWDDIILPSREEVLAKRKADQEKAEKAMALLGKSKTDISYLTTQGNSGLAARLAQAKMNSKEDSVPKKASSIGGQPGAAPISPPRLELSPTEKRRADRLAREARAEEMRALRASKQTMQEKSQANAVLRNANRQIESFNKVAHTLKIATSPSAPPLAPAVISDSMKLAKESAVKRRAARVSRQARAASQPDREGDEGVQEQRGGRRGSRAGRTTRARGPNTRARKDNAEEILEGLEEIDSPEGFDGVATYLPDLTGPAIPQLELTPIRQPTLVSDYSRYIPEDLSFIPTRSDMLYPPTQLVQMVLSHREDVSVAKRVHAHAIVEKFTKSSRISAST